MAFTGDTLVHSPLWRRAAINADGSGYDFRPMLERLWSVLGPVDLAVCHLETPIAPEGEELSTAPTYGVPAEIADVWWRRAMTAARPPATTRWIEARQGSTAPSARSNRSASNSPAWRARQKRSHHDGSTLPASP